MHVGGVARAAGDFQRPFDAVLRFREQCLWVGAVVEWWWSRVDSIASAVVAYVAERAFGPHARHASLVGCGAARIVWWIDQVEHERSGIGDALVGRRFSAQRVLDGPSVERHSSRAAQCDADVLAASVGIQAQGGGYRHGGVVVVRPGQELLIRGVRAGWQGWQTD